MAPSQVTRAALEGRPGFRAVDDSDDSDDAAGRSERRPADPTSRPATATAGATGRRGSAATAAAAAALGKAVGVESGKGKGKGKGGGGETGRNRIDPRFQWMAYGLAFVWYMACAYMSVLYGLSFTQTIQAFTPTMPLLLHPDHADAPFSPTTHSPSAGPSYTLMSTLS